MINAQVATTLNSTETVLSFFEETIYVGCVHYISLNGHGLSAGGVNLGYDFVGLGRVGCIVHHNPEAVVCKPCSQSASDPTRGAEDDYALGCKSHKLFIIHSLLEGLIRP
jgi:hypothetical protein